MNTRVDFSTPVSGPAYSAAYRALATLLVIGLIGYGAFLVIARAPGPMTRDGWLMIGAVLLSLLGTYYLMMRSTTTIDADGIAQSGLIDRRARWDEIAYARVRRLGATRLIVRKTSGRFLSFFGGSAELEAAFDRIVAAYPRR